MTKAEAVYVDFQEAKKFINKEHSCCQVIRTRKHMALSPKYIGQISTGIKENLDSELKFYSQVLEGIPIAYSNKFTFAQSAGVIMDDCPYVHFDVVVDCVVFQPKIGSLLSGCVNKLGQDHVGCVVHGLFNASILRPHRIPYKDWEGSKLSGGDEFVFEVVKICTQSGLLSITGKFTSQSLSHKKAKRKRESDNAGTVHHSDLSVCGDAVKELPTGTVVVVKHKKKKHKHSKCLLEPFESTQTQGVSEKDRLSVGSVDSGIGVNTSESDQPRKKKKKKKKKDQEGRAEDIDIINGGVEGGLREGEQSKGLDTAFNSNSCKDLKPETSTRDIEHKHQKKKKKHKKDNKDS